MKFRWNKHEIKCAEEAYAMVSLFKSQKPEVGAFDTETTGLHIILDRPFLFQFGWLDIPNKQGYAFGIDLEANPELAMKVVKAWMIMAKDLKILLGHNVSFDLHMLLNIGVEYRTENLSDTMFYIRYAHDSVAVKNGGAPLKLKDYCARFVDRDARHHEQLLQVERTAIASRLNNKLMKDFLKGRRMKDLKPFFDDATNDPEDLHYQDFIAYQLWLKWLPDWIKGRFTNVVDSQDIPYHVLNRQTVMDYAIMDIVLTLEVWLATAPVVEFRQTQYPIDIENSLILPFLDMERVGFQIDVPYLIQSRLILKEYIHERRLEFHRLAGSVISSGQHARILRVLNENFGITCTSTEADELSRLESDLRHTGENPDGVDFIRTLQELRTLEKWYSTYILRFLRHLSHTDRLYTSINSVGTVSGRVTSDFQQFPKDAILASDGRELFHPRKMVIVTGGNYDGLVYLDYSQIELRLQAIYTILVGHPEPNLLQAYMPYLCHRRDGTPFDFQNRAHILDWEGEWFLDEDPEVQWRPLDVHAASTCLAFNVTRDHPDFKKLRSKGKTLNFSKNYGSGIRCTRAMFPEYSEEEIIRIDAAYYKAFPGVKSYHEYCYALAMQQPWSENLFGVRYYGVSGHNTINILIQGSGAFLLKLKIREMWLYAQTHGIKSRMQMNIHDEVSWEKHKDEDLTVFRQYQQIMETWEDTLVPIVAEMEVSTTTWYAKHAPEEVASATSTSSTSTWSLRNSSSSRFAPAD